MPTNPQIAEEHGISKLYVDRSKDEDKVLFIIEMEGDEVEWVERPGMKAHRAPAYGNIQVMAGDKKEAELIARELNPEYHTVISISKAS